MLPVSVPEQRILESSAILVAVAASAGMVAIGAMQGFDEVNLHNFGLGVATTLVGAYVLTRRPRHREGILLLGLGVLSALLYLTRQIAVTSSSPSDAWTGWLGVWPTAIAIALTTIIVFVFPEGRFLSKRWAVAGGAIAALGVFVSAISMLWPVEYTYMGITTPFPFELPGRSIGESIFKAVGHASYSLMIGTWIVALIARWRASDAVVRRQLLVLVIAVAVSLIVLFAGLLIADRPWPGLIAISSLPLVMGWCLERMSLGRVIEEERAQGHLEGLSPREQEVLELIALGLSNNAIAERLHLSIKTVEPAISSIFRKLGLDDDSTSNRRVQAVLAYWKR
jgi:DNA-binding CsgD family transcriptional regulator